MAEGIVARDEIFVTTKIWVEHFHRDALLRQAEESAISLGLTLCIPGDSPDTVLHRADQAMYQAKEQGRNRVALLLPALA